MKMTPALWKELTYFKPAEFPAPDQMEQALMNKLDSARHVAAVPFVITSSWRSIQHNEAVGGAKDSAHPRGYAVDIRAATSRLRFKILAGLVKAGFTRLGVYPTHVHADCDPGLDAEVMWMDT